MATQIKLPNLGENIESGDVLSILVAEGDVIKADQDIIEVETDKATMPIPSPEGGKVTMPLSKTFWSPRFGMLEDKFGIGWMVSVPGKEG